MKPPFILLFLTSLASAELVDVTLTLTPPTANENTLDLGLSVAVPLFGNFPSSDTSETSGTILARLDIDPVTGEVSTIALLSGDVTATDVNFRATNFFLGTIYNISLVDMQATVETPSPPAPVINGLTSATLHNIIINEGTLSGTSVAGDIPTQDFADEPVAGSGPEGDFIEISAVSSRDSTPTTQVFDIEFAFPVAIDQTIESDTVTGTITANGTVRALGQVSFRIAPPNPFSHLGHYEQKRRRALRRQRIFLSYTQRIVLGFGIQRGRHPFPLGK